MPTSQISASSSFRSLPSLPQQRPPALVKSPRARDLVAQQIPDRLGRLQRLDVGLGDAEEMQVLGRDVDVVAGGVGGDVLPEVGQLQRRRDLVGEAHQLGLAVAEQRPAAGGPPDRPSGRCTRAAR